MKVLQVTASLEQGGVERGTVEMAAFIVSKGAASYVASQGGRLVAELEQGGTSHFCLPLARRNPVAILYSALALKRVIQKEGIDLVHARSRAPAWAAFLASKMTGVKFVTTFHGTHRIQNGLKRFYNAVMVRGIRVIAISGFIKEHIVKNYQVEADRIDIARRGFDPLVFNRDLIDPIVLGDLRTSYSLTAEIPVICLPGRLTRWKGQELFLSALANLKDLSWQALIVGGATKKSSYVDDLKRLVAENGLSDRVVFTGNQKDIAPFYAISDVVVSASLEPEAFGRVAVEAQAMGVPVIASAHGGALETVRDGVTGWLFANGDVGDLTDKLRDSLSSELMRRKMGEQARAWVWDNFTIDKMCSAEWETYIKVLMK